ncbi:MAG TPA: phosphodiester glycosidase family protein [Vicinamibacterales bacterium]|nr:phosphodiester glycosidase family protein [Vicinamibacterales bacterium]
MPVAWIRLITLVAALAIAPAAQETVTVPGLGAGRAIAPGVLHFTLTDPALLDPPAPISVQLLRLDLTQVDLTTDLSLGDRQGRATVLSAARRREAIAAVNAGFFSLTNGDPIGPLRVDGELVSDGTLGRAAAAMIPNGRGGRPTWLFDRATVAVTAVLEHGGSIAVDGVDTTRAVGALMLYTPRYGPHSDTAPTGTEWVLEPQGAGAGAGTGSGAGYVVKDRRSQVGKSPIPRRGLVLSYGGVTSPAPLDRLSIGDRLTIRETWKPGSGQADRWRAAVDVVSGAGLLRRGGADVRDWEPEHLAGSFFGRHPRTMFGIDRDGYAWLVTVDGRQPDTSAGMTLVELQRLARRIGLTDAINLDGGGSTTMVIAGTVVNHPSDPTGARTVSDVLLVMPRRRGPGGAGG